MMNRRDALKGMSRVVLAGVGWFGSKLLAASPSRGVGTGVAGVTAPTEDFDQELQAEMTRLQARVYSEQGIPMILACENLAGGGRLVPSGQATDAALVQAFHREVDSWERLHPGAPAGEVANVVELLAYRDLTNGAGGARS